MNWYKEIKTSASVNIKRIFFILEDAYFAVRDSLGRKPTISELSKAIYGADTELSDITYKNLYKTIWKLYKYHPEYKANERYPLTIPSQKPTSKIRNKKLDLIKQIYNNLSSRFGTVPTMRELSEATGITEKALRSYYDIGDLQQQYPTWSGTKGGELVPSNPLGTSSSKNIHQLIISDIFTINGESYQINQEYDTSSYEESFVFVGKPVADFVVNGTYLELFEPNKVKSNERNIREMEEKLRQIPNLCWLNFRHTSTKQPYTLRKYARILDTDLRPDPMVKPYQNAEETLTNMIPLLSDYGLRLCSDYIEWLNVKPKGTKEELSQNLQLAQEEPPTLSEIDSSLQSYQSSDMWSPEERVAVFFKTQENIMIYLNQLQYSDLAKAASKK